MRRTLPSLMVLVMAAILPVVTIAGVCGAEAKCCAPASTDQARLSRANCCADPCADVTREATSAADAAKQSHRLDRGIDEVSTVAITSHLPARAAAVDASAAAPSPPDLDRRLASLSILLI